MIKFLDLHSQYLQCKDEIDNAIRKVIETSSYIGGETVANFELDFAAYQEADNCVGVGNGTDALEIALEGLNLAPGSEVIVPANSFIASSEAVTRSKLKVVFCDIDPKNYTLDVESARSLITSNTSAIMAVHLYGHPCDMDSVCSLAREFNLKVIEDCAQAHGAKYKGRKIGAIGDVGAFSFYPGKNLGAYGDGGAITTNNHELAQRCRMIANHGRVAKYDHLFEGRNSRLDGLQAAILSVKLKKLDSWLEQRNVIARQYLRNFEQLSGPILPAIEDWAFHAFHLFVMRVPEPQKLQEFLTKEGVQSGVHYPVALPKLAAYQYLSAPTSHFRACQYDSQLISLPIGDHMSLTDADFASKAVCQYFSSI